MRAVEPSDRSVLREGDGSLQRAASCFRELQLAPRLLSSALFHARWIIVRERGVSEAARPAPVLPERDPALQRATRPTAHTRSPSNPENAVEGTSESAGPRHMRRHASQRQSGSDGATPSMAAFPGRGPARSRGHYCIAMIRQRQRPPLSSHGFATKGNGALEGCASRRITVHKRQSVFKVSPTSRDYSDEAKA
jgi:hypothetical protein